MINKIIHYCWFGENPIPEEMQSFIDDWHKKLVGYKFKLWSENNFDISLAPIFVQEAYSYRKFAFVADYVRLYALYTEGGVYLDTDICVVKTFDSFLNDGFFSSIEYHQDMVDNLNIVEDCLDGDFNRKSNVAHVKGIGIQSAMFGAEKGHPFMKDCMEYYEKIHFVQADGSFFDKIILPDVLALCAEKYGFRYVKDRQVLRSNINIYPQFIFAGKKNATEDSVAIHCAHNSWRETTLLQRLFNVLASNSSIVNIKTRLVKYKFLSITYNWLKTLIWLKK